MDDDHSRHAAAHEGAGIAGGAGPGAPSASLSTRPRRWRLRLLGVFLILLPLLLFVAWTASTLHWTYSRGDRAGYVQKFSQKGWVCKTWEGELAMVPIPGVPQERFAFSVRDDSIAHEITRLMGSQVSLTYEQHRGVPTRCFGETEYYVIGVRRVGATP
jgi:hypothetical protein